MLVPETAAFVNEGGVGGPLSRIIAEAIEVDWFVPGGENIRHAAQYKSM